MKLFKTVCRLPVCLLLIFSIVQGIEAEKSFAQSIGFTRNSGRSPQRRVAALGNSITSDGGFVNRLNVLRWDIQFDNYGISGESTSKILRRLCVSGGNPSGKELNLLEYDELIVLAGVNNIWQPDRVIDDLKTIYALGKMYGLRVIAVTLTPWKGYPTWTRKAQANTDRVNAWIMTVPENVDVVVDAYTPLEDPERPDCLRNTCRQGDRLHPRGGGQTAIAAAIFSAAYK